MSIFRIALLQLLANGFDQEANLQKGERFCREAKKKGASLALFPEMWNVGYTFFDPADPPSLEKWQQQAVDSDSDFVQHFQRLAKELNMAIALTYLEKWPVAPRNTVSLIDRHGDIVLTYAKVHTCDFDVEAALTPGDAFKVASLDTEDGPVSVGAMICYDREFPESARILMLQGAEIIITPNSCNLESNRIGQFRARAFENMVGLALANYATPQNNGHSVAFSPIVFDESGTSLDPTIVEAGEEEGVYLADFDIKALRDYRQREAWGNAYRKPLRYSSLTSANVLEPFVRFDAKR